MYVLAFCSINSTDCSDYINFSDSVPTHISLPTSTAIPTGRVDTKLCKNVPWHIALVKVICTSGTEMTSLTSQIRRNLLVET